MNISNKNKALIKIFGYLVKDTGKLLLDPYIGNVSSIIEGLVINSKNFYDEMNKKKLYELYMGIEQLDDDTEKKFTRANLAFLIKKFMQDDEDNKTHLYSKLAINISKSDIPDEQRIDFISMLSALTVYDINFMKKVYIYDIFDIKGFKNTAEQLLKITESQEGREIKSINKLYANGLIFEPNKGKAAGQYYKPTEYLKNFILMLFDSQELTPDAIGEHEKNKSDIFFMKNSEYMSKKEYYDELVINSLESLGYSLIINTEVYGPYNDKSSIYMSIDNDKALTKGENGELFLQLIIKTNEDVFFNRKNISPDRYLLSLDDFNKRKMDNDKDTNEIKKILRSIIEELKNQNY
ncbi:hypothetical protein C3432_12755 [Citrobacter amalonaticus]|uniref:Uncharacterized protein n=1 Tax=Citrobacter amalonaticus TaxID=35703 RepID=A0A2S4RQE5_CITAM|nr:hypothetical protein [Citrobacter amalonaticus]POT56303.1 hypothetical protein C3432_12755 [Citrobacter amalonaticus]POT74827.1 hypothetical protein C3436_13225 [Citrobacter amalonaticus]POU60076.1 hypothetical protein C3430_26160 [Citrobacter amalonaticus]POV02487.1 hypothetical protein C3424_26360 [Citrobacter amalonaticus]